MEMAARPLRYSREDIIVAAVELLDEVGLPDLTMRRLAQTLNIQPSALYWHVTDKQTLLAAVADRILSRTATVPAGSPWDDALAAHAHAIRSALLAYRDAAEVVASSVALGLGGDATVQRLRAVVAMGGFDENTTRAGASAILHFVLGHVWNEQQRAHADGFEAAAPSVELTPTDLNNSAAWAAADFNFGVTLLVSGLAEQRHARVSRTGA
jgi:TetR/AcrR family tetracycline transcriptional repressor